MNDFSSIKRYATDVELLAQTVGVREAGQLVFDERNKRDHA